MTFFNLAILSFDTSNDNLIMERIAEFLYIDVQKVAETLLASKRMMMMIKISQKKASGNKRKIPLVFPVFIITGEYLQREKWITLREEHTVRQSCQEKKDFMAFLVRRGFFHGCCMDGHEIAIKSKRIGKHCTTHARQRLMSDSVIIVSLEFLQLLMYSKSTFLDKKKM